MKVRIEIDESKREDEVVIYCSSLSNEVVEIQKAVLEKQKKFQDILLYKGNTEYYLPIKDILFFETFGDSIFAHTKLESFSTDYKLYSLEEILPDNFMRISKSTIVNMDHIYSITRNVTASSEIKLHGTHKCVYVSRNYYKKLSMKLEEKRIKR